MSEAVRLINILLVEDSAEDITLTREALGEAKVANALHVVRDGEEALAFLQRKGEFADKPRPDLILLDLNLPRKDGRQVLTEIKADEELRRIPVIVLTTSSSDEDILAAYDMHVNSYISKPIGVDEFISVVRTIEDYWVGIVTLPPR
jgi:chemotaxis family two-component system response regulator Rcp1